MNQRLPALVILFGLLVAMGVADRAERGEPEVEFGTRQPFVMAVADPASALSSTWYCAGGTAAPRGLADLAVAIANPRERDVAGTITWMPSDGEAVTVPFELGGYESLEVRARTALDVAFAAAVVEVDAGQVVVEQIGRSASGIDVTACAPSASGTWYLAHGVTTRDATQVLAVLNPFPDDAVLDLSFSTDEGRAEPQALQGLVVPAASLQVIDLGEHVRRREAVATSIVARSGRVVVARVQAFDGTEGRSGLATTLAAPAPGLLWHFPEGFVDEGVIERIHVYNPGEGEALVDVELNVADESPEPIELTVSPGSAVTVVIGETERIDPGTPHAITVRSANEVPVVAEREVDARAEGARRGFALTPGSALAAPAWMLAAGEASEAIDYWLVLFNPGSEPVTASVRALGGGRLIDVPGLQDLELGPAGRVVVRLGERLARIPLPVLVEASGPIVVERDLYRVGEPGVSTSMGIPLRR